MATRFPGNTMNTHGKTVQEAPAPSHRRTSENAGNEVLQASLLATFAHDMRSPLSSIRTGIEVLKLSLGDPQQAEKLLSMLERQTLEMVRLLEGLGESGPSLTDAGNPVSGMDADAAPASPRKVLVVDDSRSAADVLTLFFKMEGLDVHSVYLGQDALDLAREMKPDVVFLDLGLPDLSGYEVVAKIRELPGGDQCFIVALTGRDEEDDRRNIVKAGFDLHVVKPPEPRVLREVLLKSAAKVR